MAGTPPSRPLRRLLSRVFSSVVGGTVRLSGRAPRIILTYHRVGHEDGCVQPEALEEQIGRARAAGFEFVPVSRMVEWVKHGSELPGRAVALTFDDGLADTARTVGPLLQRLGAPAMVFPVLEFLGGPRRYASVKARDILLEDDGDPRTVPYDYMSWDELDGWVENGNEVGGHTLGHPFLGSVDAERGLAEIRGCREQLTRRYGKPPAVFCYPYGDHGGQAATWVRQSGFEAAVTSDEGVLERDCDVFHLPRLPAPPDAGRSFIDLLNGVFLWRQRLPGGR